MMLLNNILRLTFFCLCIINIQESRGQTNGLIIIDSIPVEGIHILNLNTNLGVITNENGEFEIETSLNDTLFFSGVKFYPKKIIIEAAIGIENKMVVELEEFTNELNEVFLDNKNVLLVGLGREDTSEKPKISPSALNFSFEYSDQPYEMTADDRMTTSSNDQISMFLGGGGLSLIDVVAIILSPLVKIGKTRRGERKRSKKRKVNHEKEVSVALDKIRPDFGDHFFIETLQLPKEHIDFFIKYCESKDIAELFVRDNRFGLTEVFLEEIKGYKILHNLR